MIERMVNVERVEDLIAVFGSFDENIRRIEDALEVKIVNRGNELKVVGDEEAGDLLASKLSDGGGGSVGVQDLQFTDGGGDQEDLVHHGGVLASIEDLLAGLGAVDVQKQQHEEGQHDVDHRVAHLIAAVAQRALFTF